MTSQLKLICVLAHPDKFLKAIEVGRNLDFCLLERFQVAIDGSRLARCSLVP